MNDTQQRIIAAVVDILPYWKRVYGIVDALDLTQNERDELTNAVQECFNAAYRAGKKARPTDKLEV